MSSAAIYSTDFASLRDTDTVAAATRRMLDDRVADLPVTDGSGTLVGMFRLARLFEVLLPRAAQLDYGMPDLAFMGDGIELLQRRMREIEDQPVRNFIVAPEHVVHPETTPLEAVLLLYKGANAVPVVAPASGRLVGMVTAREVLFALQPRGSR